MKKQTKKLTLSRETVRELDLVVVSGGSQYRQPPTTSNFVDCLPVSTSWFC